VESAIAVTQALAVADSTGHLPSLVVSLGSAGSRTLPQGGVYQASTVSYRDMDASPIGFPRGETPFLDLPAIVPVGPMIPGLPQASLSTGANIVSGAAYDGIDADMVDMETFAILRACQRFAVPLVAIRGISDGASELTHIGDWTAYLHVIDERLADVVGVIETWVDAGGLKNQPLSV
jgi:adenosylhomocysteine nucleosidase